MNSTKEVTRISNHSRQTQLLHQNIIELAEMETTIRTFQKKNLGMKTLRALEMKPQLTFQNQNIKSSLTRPDFHSGLYGLRYHY